MNDASAQPEMRRILSLSAQVALAAIALFLGLRLWALVAFPFGGGEYHAIFAYSEGGRLSAAFTVYAVYIASLLSTAVALRLVGLSLSWRHVALITGVLGVHAWMGIAMWQPRSPAFSRTVIGLLLALPVIIGVTVRFAYSRLSGTDARQPARLAVTRIGRLVGVGVLVAPYVWVALILSTPFRQRIARAQWMPSEWERSVGGERVVGFDATQGIVFEAERARELLRQCTRSTPGAVTGTWTPSPEQIAILEEDLARYLVRHDTGRTRASGFVMPPFHQYFRQYGGLRLAGEGDIIYVNALLPGFFTDETESGSPAAWRREAISVCGGWQAYFGVEYSPKTRQFRRFSYNPSPE